ncbi:WD and tetratricopeptide repeats protein 1 isoform X2 [Scaptodrosophila lebanonensis]|uniref:WD and tetratricopeptide repeats protein 1 isoform X2 n=1 Tax=Drosophila lebanonensis TaxID=7225 RepID=A0A6J2TNA3_DROLE|nr:WD and tetratricopeptide repeats protein 1 isoform X2 [Scaptodrosophila lebanonensis]
MSGDEESTPPPCRTVFSSSRYHYGCNGRAPLNVTSLQWHRQQVDVEDMVRRRLLASPCYIDRLEQEAVLTGHDGCVNCMEWSNDGLLLASGSDDYKVMIWDPFRKRRVHVVHTKHLGNMFSVKFLPRHNNSIVATCAADKFIYVYDINHTNETIFSCSCHTMRAKRLATAPDSPHVFWSAGEDGNILQLDMREPHRCRNEDSRVRLISLCTLVESITEAKCLAINPRRTEYLAVGANDPYARVYDRRMLHLMPAVVPNEFTGPGETLATGCATYFAPGQIVKKSSWNVDHDGRAITYLTFNENGTELLVNMGCEHVYRYDLNNAVEPIFYSLPAYTPPPAPPSSTGEDSSASCECKAPTKSHTLPIGIEHHKKLALAKYPKGEVLYLNRATALMRRGWFGDIYAALRDCHEALRLDPSYVKAHFRLSRALLELHRPREADKCLQELIQRFPNFANNHGVLMLHKDIREGVRHKTPDQPAAGENGFGIQRFSEVEYELRCASRDYRQRYVGHCNVTTDIKEANYLGAHGEFIVAGSDDGNFFIWEGETAKIRAVYRADSAIVNCVQPHPSICMLATSGIDHDIKIWSPCASSDSERPNLVSDVARSVEENQKKMHTDPFDLNTRNTYCFNN